MSELIHIIFESTDTFYWHLGLVESPRSIMKMKTKSLFMSRVSNGLLMRTHLKKWQQKLKISLRSASFVYQSKATFTLHRFHFDPFLLPKTGLFSFLFTLLRFQTETDIYQLVFTLFLKNASVFLFLTTRPSRLLILAFSNCSVFGVHTTELRFCLAPFSFSSVFIIVFI